MKRFFHFSCFIELFLQSDEKQKQKTVSEFFCLTKKYASRNNITAENSVTHFFFSSMITSFLSIRLDNERKQSAPTKTHKQTKPPLLSPCEHNEKNRPINLENFGLR